jgi:SAM-dependent methyltransferase
VTDYAAFAAFYDRIVGDRTQEVDRIRSYLSKHSPQARSLLELGCGTGAILAGLADELAVTGVDRSPEMLAFAAARVPTAHLVQADMTAFHLQSRFDVVICMFDTLNHLLSYSAWHELFDRAYEHLEDGGLFIFDVNTAGRLHRLSGGPPYVDEFDGNVVIMTVRSARDGLSLWETRIFEHLIGREYRLHHERIHELGVPLTQIRATLEGRFELLEQDGLYGDAPTEDADRVFFACRRRSLAQRSGVAT